MAIVSRLVSSYYILVLILTGMHCNGKESWTTIDGNFRSSFEAHDLSQDGFTEDNVHGTSPNTFSLPCSREACPPWMYCDNGICRCGDSTHSILKCDDNWPGEVSVLDCYCLTYNGEEDTNEVGHCLFNCARNVSIDSLYYLLPMNVSKLNAAMCKGFDREGTLCGKCKDTLYPKAYSFDMKCIKCSNRVIDWLKFIIVSFVPLTIFCFIVLFFKISVNSPHLRGFILFCQIMTMPVMARLFFIQTHERSEIQKFCIQCLLTVYGFWNLDFFRSFDLGICLGTGTLATLALDIAVGVYPLLLMIFSFIMIHLYDKNFLPLVILWRLFRRVISIDWDMKTSVIDSYATFFLLSNVKLMSACFDLLVPTHVYQLNITSNTNNAELRLFYDASIVYNGPHHRPYFILAIGVLFVYGFLPVIILILYPFKWFQKILNVLPVRWYVLHTFVDSFQGFYKNGTEQGSRDCRWFASLFFIVRLSLMLVGAVTLSMSYFVFGAIILTIFILLIIVIQPFKEDKGNYSTINATFIIILCLFYSSLLGDDRAVFKQVSTTPFFLYFGFVLATVPLLYMIVVVLCWAWKQREFGLEIIRRVCALRRRYELLT